MGLEGAQATKRLRAEHCALEEQYATQTSALEDALSSLSLAQEESAVQAQRAESLQELLAEAAAAGEGAGRAEEERLRATVRELRHKLSDELGAARKQLLDLEVRLFLFVCC